MQKVDNIREQYDINMVISLKILIKEKQLGNVQPCIL